MRVWHCILKFNWSKIKIILILLESVELNLQMFRCWIDLNFHAVASMFLQMFRFWTHWNFRSIFFLQVIRLGVVWNFHNVELFFSTFSPA